MQYIPFYYSNITSNLFQSDKITLDPSCSITVLLYPIKSIWLHLRMILFYSFFCDPYCCHLFICCSFYYFPTYCDHVLCVTPHFILILPTPPHPNAFKSNNAYRYLTYPNSLSYIIYRR